MVTKRSKKLRGGSNLPIPPSTPPGYLSVKNNYGRTKYYEIPPDAGKSPPISKYPSKTKTYTYTKPPIKKFEAMLDEVSKKWNQLQTDFKKQRINMFSPTSISTSKLKSIIKTNVLEPVLGNVDPISLNEYKKLFEDYLRSRGLPPKRHLIFLINFVNRPGDGGRGQFAQDMELNPGVSQRKSEAVAMRATGKRTRKGKPKRNKRKRKSRKTNQKK